MEKSIESIWKEGFIKNDTLIAPRLNNLYDQKSTNTVDKLMKLGKRNHYAIIIGASIFFTASILLGAAIAGLLICILLTWLVLSGMKQTKIAERIDKGANSYEYLTSIDSWLKNAIKEYIKIYRVFYPAFFILIFFGIFYSNFGQDTFSKVLVKFPNMDLIYGVPLYPMIGTFVVATLSSIFAGALFRLDLKSVYGRVMSKLDELRMEMEELN
ncbi:MAG: hypothetical protein ACI9J3_002657 [Parvicellaceae bacterium]|jgi:hypothetical protein